MLSDVSVNLKIPLYYVKHKQLKTKTEHMGE